MNLSSNNETIIQSNLDIMDIQKYLKSRPPLLMIDFVDEIIVGKCARGFKNFSNNEWFFPCHFLDNPNVPGCIQLEILIEMFIMSFITLPECTGKETADARVNNLIFKKKIVPGDKLYVVAELKSFSCGLARGNAKGYVNQELACSSDLVVVVPDLLKIYTPTRV